MSIETFIWTPLVEPQGTTQFRTRVAQFGDGYSQAVADGINNRADTWPLTFAGRREYIDVIRAFLDARKGCESFYWTPPQRDKGLFRADTYACTAHGGEIYTLSVTFNEVH